MTAVPFKQRLWDSVRLPFVLVGILWIIHLVQFILQLDFGYLGTYPREVFGLRGIFLSPLIHGDFGHLLSNTPPLFVLSALLLFFYRRVAFPAFTMIYLLTGLAVWLFGRSVFHIGASGVIYGLVAFVFWTGIFRRNIKSIVLALIIVFYYGSMFLGILPGQEGISWESHLMGAVVGIFVAFWFKNNIEDDEKPKRYSWEDDPKALEKESFLDSDIFKYPRSERERRANDSGEWFSNHT